MNFPAEQATPRKGSPPPLHFLLWRQPLLCGCLIMALFASPLAQQSLRDRMLAAEDMRPVTDAEDRDFCVRR